MNKFLIAASFLAFGFSFAQESAEPAMDKDMMTWYHKDFKTTGIYGVNTENAYKFLESKGLKPKTVVVGVLDSGVEVDHPGLIGNMWKNPNEIPNNGIDDDKNGYIDDIHGWNFIGGKNGDVDADNLEITRVYKIYKPMFEGGATATNKANQAKMPEEFAMYMKAKGIFETEGEKAKKNYQRMNQINLAIPTIVKLMDGKTLSPELIAGLKPANSDETFAAELLSNISKGPGMMGKNSTEISSMVTEQIQGGLDYYGAQANQQYSLTFDPRAELVGDNYADYSEKNYGNNHYEGPDALHGTHVSGIIAGLPHDGEVQYGVASKVAKIMTVRTVPNGDERDKDVANSIKYAVDNGAKILNMSFGKSVSPGKQYVWDAFKYAQDKGVLLVKASGNDNEDIEVDIHYPTNFKSPTDEKSFLTNLITVGASTDDPESLRAGFSNYNGKMVDVFAPGQEIYSTVIDGKYQYLQGTSMASPVVAGAAAVLLAYMPNLKPYQLIEALVNTSNKSTVDAKLPNDDKKTFDQISRSGGVIDVAKAAEYAYNNFYMRKAAAKKSTKTKKAVKRK
ncbi:S8 family serine peptidase [Frigoriflavimonas asaccharolytica]|uniref:Subtilisin family serine protease n=1 Tax=Frigoriflavimonas asaccharolytica TaxID=2735899 RepID=A0A8J8KCP9_9FLAO|nr:S8 family serine peptidase [Frigoriflavimonas asaccharolytica]NRS93889.1 subtilisin family serine protease [Frigoriflavimonas asaccharolytica]